MRERARAAERRSSCLPMLARCTSSGPSARRRVRASAYSRASGVSPHTPAAPCTCPPVTAHHGPRACRRLTGHLSQGALRKQGSMRLWLSASHSCSAAHIVHECSSQCAPGMPIQQAARRASSDHVSSADTQACRHWQTAAWVDRVPRKRTPPGGSAGPGRRCAEGTAPAWLRPEWPAPPGAPGPAEACKK